MFIKIVVVLAICAIAFAHPIDHASSYVDVHHDESPLYEYTLHNNEENKDDFKYNHQAEKHFYRHPQYVYKYGVEDYHTGDKKSLKESRDGDVVKGEYSVVQPDGRIRIVKYTADQHNGFKAEVVYSGHAIHPIAEKKSENVEETHEYYH